jgi:hypothetical protein
VPGLGRPPASYKREWCEPVLSISKERFLPLHLITGVEGDRVLSQLKESVEGESKIDYRPFKQGLIRAGNLVDERSESTTMLSIDA